MRPRSLPRIAGSTMSALLALLLSTSSSCVPWATTRAQSSGTAKITSRETVVGRLPADASGVIVSPDGRRIAYPLKVDGGMAVCIDGAPAKTFDKVLEYTLVFSPDSKRIAYLAERGGKRFTVVDGVEGAAFEGLFVTPAIFSPDSKRVATPGIRGGKGFVVLDGVENPAYDSVYFESLIFSPDSKHVAYGVEKRGKMAVIVDGVEGKPYECPDPVPTQTDLKYMIYMSLTGKEATFVLPLYHGIAGEKGSGSVMSVACPCILFSPDSKRVAYIARDKNEVFWVIDGVEQRKGLNATLLHNRACYTSPTNMQRAAERRGCYGLSLDADKSPFSPDSQRFGYVAARASSAQKKKSYSFVVLDGVEIDVPAFCIDFHFSPDSERTAFIRNTLTTPTAVVDGVAREWEYVSWESVCFSPDSKRVVHTSRSGDLCFTVLDGSPGTQFRDVAALGQYAFSPDSRRTMAVMQRKDQSCCIVVDGVAGPTYDGVIPIGFTADSRHVAYIAMQKGKWLLVADQQEGKRYDRIFMGDYAFQAPGKVGFFALNGETRELTRVECEIVENAVGSR